MLKGSVNTEVEDQTRADVNPWLGFAMALDLSRLKAGPALVKEP